jgi:hypothetical protein
MNKTTKTLAILSAVLAIGIALAGFAVPNAFAQTSSSSASSVLGDSASAASANQDDASSAAAGSAEGQKVDCFGANGAANCFTFQPEEDNNNNNNND